MGFPLISVIIPFYRHAAWLAQAVDSVLAQTYSPVEILVVNDGSDEDMTLFSQQYAEKIRYFTQPNAGPAAARNRGIAQANGEYVAFLDSDDLWLPDKLTRQMVEELFAVREMAEDMEDDGDVDFEGNPADRKYYVHFNSAPTEILGEDGKVKAIRVERTETGADGKMHRTGEFTDYPVEAVYHAIGYKPAEAPGITYDEHGAHLANANGDGRITTEADGGKVRDRLYATGWAKRGPVGLIGSPKSDALAIVTNMLEDLAKAAEGGRVAADRDPESIDRLLAERGIRPIDFAGWKKVDAFERAEGAKEGREHKKVIEPDQMRELAHA